MIARRVQHIEASGIRRMFELVATMEDPVDLSIGQPDFAPPEALQEAAVEAIRCGWNRYTVTQGLPGLNDRILARYSKRHGVRPEASMVTCGASGGVLLSFLCLLNPGDEILLPDPYFMMYRHLAILCGASPRYYSLYPDFRLPLEEMASLVSEKTRVILVNSPSNPTGAVYSAAELEAVAALADRVGAVLLSDEVYDEFVYDEPFVSAGRFSHRAVILGGFSKTLGIPGWRLGYALGPKEILEAMCTLQQFTFVCAPAPLQKAVLDTWELDISRHVDAYRVKRDRVVKGLSGGFRLVPPLGSFYAFPAFPEAVSPEEILARCIERKLLLVPGSAFSARSTHFRISFATSDEKLAQGLEILNGLIH